MKKKEFRNLDINVKEDSRVIEGVIPYNSKSEYMGYYEILNPGCFTRTLRESKDIRALYGHEENRLLARTKNGSLRFEDKEDGLHFNFDVPETTEGNDALEMVRSGLIDGCSFGFSAITDKYEIQGGDEVRTILEARLYEVSLCGNPAYLDTKVYARSLSEAMKEKELDDSDKEAIQKEIDALTALLPKEDNNAPQPEPEPAPNEVIDQKEEEQPQVDEKQLCELMERLEKAEEIINRNYSYED